MYIGMELRVMVMVFDATFNNISVLSMLKVLYAAIACYLSIIHVEQVVLIRSKDFKKCNLIFKKTVVD